MCLKVGQVRMATRPYSPPSPQRCRFSVRSTATAVGGRVNAESGGRGGNEHRRSRPAPHPRAGVSAREPCLSTKAHALPSDGQPHDESPAMGPQLGVRRSLSLLSLPPPPPAHPPAHTHSPPKFHSRPFQSFVPCSALAENFRPVAEAYARAMPCAADVPGRGPALTP